MPDSSVIFCLTVAIIVLTIAMTVLASTLPLLWWKVLRLEKDVADVDEAVAHILEAAGLKAQEKGT